MTGLRLGGTQLVVLARSQMGVSGGVTGLGVGESGVHVLPVGEQQGDAFERAGAVRVNTRRVG
jgi:hypothetical protein